MKITFLGAAHEVTGSCTLIEACGKKILVDCGMEQGADIYESGDIPVLPSEIDYVFLTHAHIDHSGKIPMLCKNGFSGRIYSTDATKKLCAIMLLDSARIQESEAVWRNRRAARSGKDKYEPLYVSDDVKKAMELFDGRAYGEMLEISEGIKASFFDEGHLLGSAGIRFAFTEDGKTETVVFSGDIGNPGRPLLKDPCPPETCDTVIIESTYGDRLHGNVFSDNGEKLAKIISETLSVGGNVIIPCFAVGRTQELLYMLRNIKEKNLAHIDFPVWLDSPLAIEATGIYDGDLRDYYDDETLALLTEGKSPIRFKGLNVSVSSDDSKRLNADPTPKVIISASGMCEAGRIRHHLKYNIWRRECTVLFVGYQVGGTLGRSILDGEKYISLFGEEVAVRARIEQLDGISAHGDRDYLIKWLSCAGSLPKRVYVNHGEDSVCEKFASDVKETLGIEAIAPYYGDEFDLISGEMLKAGDKKRAGTGKGKKTAGHVSKTWEKLLSAGKRLMSVIEKCKGKKQKDITRFTSDINALCNEYEKQTKKRK